MGKSFVRIAVDSSIINWKASQGLDASIQSNNEKRKEYEAILKLFKLQDQGQLILVALDQVDKELSRISNESKRANRLEILSLCKEKFYLTRFATETISKRAEKSTGKCGINLGEGSYWITKDNERRINQYVTSGRDLEEKVDLEVLATAAIAGVRYFVTVDDELLANEAVKRFASEQDGIGIYRPTEMLRELDVD